MTIQGGSLAGHREVLRWILACGEAGQTVQYHTTKLVAGFAHYAMVVLSCERLEVPVLRAQLMARMLKIAARQVHSADVAKVFANIRGPHKIKQMVCESIAQAMWERRCQAAPAYWQLVEQEQFKEFNDGLNAHYLTLERAYSKTPAGEAKRAAQQETEKGQIERQELHAKMEKQSVQQQIARLHNVEPADVTVRQDGCVTLSVEVQQVRNARGGKPGYVAVDLGKLGVTPQQFRARQEPWRQPSWKGRSPAQGKGEADTDIA